MDDSREDCTACSSSFGLLIFSIVHQRKSKKKVAEGKIALRVERFLELRDDFLWPAAPGKDLAMYRIDDEGEGVRFLGAPDQSQLFVVPPQILQEFRIPLLSGSVSRVNDQRPVRLSLGTVKILKDKGISGALPRGCEGVALRGFFVQWITSVVPQDRM